MLRNILIYENRESLFNKLTKNLAIIVVEIKLYFKETTFVEEKKLQLKDSEIAFLEIEMDKKEAKLTFKPECRLVDKKIAERQAQGICKSGFLLESGERVGIGCNLVISG